MPSSMRMIFLNKGLRFGYVKVEKRHLHLDYARCDKRDSQLKNRFCNGTCLLRATHGIEVQTQSAKVN